MDEKRPRILICDPIALEGVEMLRDVADVDIKTDLSPAQLLETIGDYQGIVVRSATKVTAEVIERGEQLIVIGRAGSGLDNIDLKAAKKRNVEVVNAPGANAGAVAELTIALLLALARHVPRAVAGMKAGKWEKKKLKGLSLSGKTLGLIGFGQIGQKVATRAKAFDMRVIAHQRNPDADLCREIGVEIVEMETLLKKADFVSLHVPANAETKHMIGADQLALMKPTAYLINTARGSILDEAALLEALNDGQIAGAALDVYVVEPATDNPLVAHEQVIATPHIAASTDDAQRLAATIVAEQVNEILASEEAELPLPLEVVPLDKVFPHENIDPQRVNRLAERLEEDMILSNPPIVIKTNGRYVVLDGATRTTAMKKLGYQHIIVQLVTDKKQLNLHTWFHAIRKIECDRLVKLLDDLPEISMIETSPQKVLDEMLETGGLCYLETVKGRVFLVRPAPGMSRLDAINRFVETYMEAGLVSRTLSRDVEALRHEFPDLKAVVFFSEYEVEQVLQVARAGKVLPAGITRFIIPGRVLRLNIDLEYLKSSDSLRQKNRWLSHLLVDKLANNRIRYYAEPVYLLDE